MTNQRPDRTANGAQGQSWWEMAMTPRLTCDHCGDVLGVYEPVVVVTAGRARETSLAADPAIGTGVAARYHRDCYLEGVAEEGDGDLIQG
jgi:hypothetical protein